MMIVADGEDWERTRDAIMPHLSASCVAKDYATVIQSVAEQIFDELADRSVRAAAPHAGVRERARQTPLRSMSSP
jgi:cytochrome P450